MTDPGQSLAITEWLALLGFKAVTLVAAFFGASVALVGTPLLNFWQLVLSVFAAACRRAPPCATRAARTNRRRLTSVDTQTQLHQVCPSTV